MDSHIADIQKAMKKKKLEWLLITSEPNLHWLTGEFDLDAVAAIPVKGDAVVITSELDRVRIPKKFKTEVAKKEFWHDVLKLGGRCASVGYEDAKLSVRSFNKISKKLEGKLVPASDLLTQLREIKTNDEVTKIRKAAQITSLGMRAAAKAIRVGATERQVAAAAEAAMRRAGAEWFAFDTIVAAGEHAGVPHKTVTDRKIGKHDLVVVDIGARYNGYNADMTRTFCLKPGTKERAIYQTTLSMYMLAVKKIRPGVRASVLDKTARDVARKLRLHKAFIHSLGHGVGIDIHEGPSLSLRSHDKLKLGMIFTIEPGLYFDGWGGVRIEDTFLLTPAGPKLLTNFPRKLMP